MENEKIEPKNILPEDIENTAGRKNIGNEYEITKLNEQKAKEEREKIEKLKEKSKELIEASKKLIEASEEKKKEPDDSSS